jgi:lambda family phage portal protein
MFETLEKYMTDTEREAFNAAPAKALSEDKKTARRSYKGARRDRTTSDWLTSGQTTNAILRMNLRTLRERSRDLAKNDPYAKKFFRLLKSNVVGKGITLQVKVSDRTKATDQKLTSGIEKQFKDWGKKQNCTLSGKLSWTEAQALFLTHVARDGEALCRLVITDKNKFGFGLKFFSPAWLDESYNETLAGGNRVIMSVEVDSDDKPVAYWFTPPNYDYQIANKLRKRFRVPAEEIIHAFLVSDDEDQTRGVPWIHASMIRLKMLDGYQEGELVKKRTEACQMGFAIPPPDETQETPDEDDEGRHIQNIQEVEPGVIVELGPGYDFKQFTPSSDNSASDFKKTTLRGVAAGMEVSYHELTGDLESVNYSSARIGSLSDRDVWTELQTFMIENFCEPVYLKWLEVAFLKGVLNITLKDYDRIKESTFRGRGWSWVDPKKEIEAQVLGLQNKTTTLTDVLAEKGIDIEEHFETLKRERELATSFGFNLEEIYKPKKAANTAPKEPPEDE